MGAETQAVESPKLRHSSGDAESLRGSLVRSGIPTATPFVSASRSTPSTPLKLTRHVSELRFATPTSSFSIWIAFLCYNFSFFSANRASKVPSRRLRRPSLRRRLRQESLTIRLQPAAAFWQRQRPRTNRPMPFRFRCRCQVLPRLVSPRRRPRRLLRKGALRCVLLRRPSGHSSRGRLPCPSKRRCRNCEAAWGWAAEAAEADRWKIVGRRLRWD